MLTLLLTTVLFAPPATALSVHGAVVGPDDRPFPDARVIALAEDPTSTHVARSTPLAEARTDERGRYTLGLLEAPTSFRVIVTAEDFAPSILTAISVHDSSMAIQTLRLLPPETLTGQVLLPNGDPAVNATLRIDDRTGRAIRSVTADDQGRFSVDGLPRGAIRVAAHAAGAAWLERTIDLADSHQTRARIELVSGIDFHGMATTPSGAPVAEASIRVHLGGRALPPAGGLLIPWSALTDDEGRFELTGMPLAPAEGTVLSARHLEHPSLDVPLAEALESETSVAKPYSLGFDEGVHLLLAADVVSHEPPTFVEARYEVFTQGEAGWRRVEGVILSDGARVISPSKWEIVIPQGGVARLHVVGEGKEVAKASDLPITDAGSEPIVVSFSFPTPRSLSGVVRGPTGLGIPNMRVEVAPATNGPGDWRIRRTITSGDGGSFQFDDLPPGGYSLRARAGEFLGPAIAAFLPETQDATGIDVPIKDAAFVEGMVQVVGAAPRSPVLLNAVRYHRMGRTGVWRTVASCVTNPDGSYRIGPISPGRLLVVPVEPPTIGDGAISRHEAERDEQDMRGWKLSALAREGATQSLDIDLILVRRAHLSGVVTVNQVPRAELQVMIRSKDGGFFDTAVTDPEGRFRLRLEGAGPFVLETRGGAIVDRRSIDPEPGVELVLEIAIEVGAVSGQLEYAEPGPEPARLMLESPRAPSEDEPYPWEVVAQGIAKPDGSFAFAEVTSGRYRITVQDVAQTLAQVSTAPFRVIAKGRHDLPALRVPRGGILEVAMTKSEEGRFPFASLEVRAADGETPLSRVFLGWFVEDKASVRSLPPGRVHVTLIPYGPWVASDPMEITLPEDGTGATLEFSVTPEPDDGSQNMP